MKNILDIKIKSLTQNESVKVVDSLRNLLSMFGFLDLRRLKKIVIAQDVNAEINLIKKSKHKEDSSVFAKVITIVEKNRINIVIVMRKSLALSLVKTQQCNVGYKEALHIFHHELAHVHDYNKKIDVFEKHMIAGEYQGIQMITYPLAEVCWSEYIANFISSSSTNLKSFPILTAEILAQLVMSITKDIKTKMMVYKSNKNRIDIIEDIKKDVEKTIKTAAYLLGYLHGLNITLAELSDEIDFQISKSRFKDTWDLMSFQLSSMRIVYPYGWERLRIYEDLADCFRSFYKDIGLTLKENEKKELYFIVA